MIITYTAGKDYITDVVTVEVPAGNGPTEVPIPIVDDEIRENIEQYFVGVLGISGNSRGAQIGDINTTLLIIVDDEGKYKVWFERGWGSIKLIRFKWFCHFVPPIFLYVPFVIPVSLSRFPF